MKKPIIGYVGLSHLGLCYSVAAASKNFNVVAYDTNHLKIKKINKYDFEIKEKNLSTVLKKNKKNIYFTSKIKDLINCDIVFLSHDVPTNTAGESNYKIINIYLEKLVTFIRKKTIVVILCQVYPGFTRKIKWPFPNLYYQVETLVFGDAMERSINPERIIIGSYQPEKKINYLFANFLRKFNCPILNIKYESAELAKLTINMFLIASISTSNSLARICELIDADWSEIIPTIKSDRRIGKFAYLKPGLGLSGGNLERDLYTVEKYYNSIDRKNNIFNSFFQNSNFNKKWVLKKLRDRKTKINKKSIITILGFAYKPDTNSTKNSPAIFLIKQLSKYNIVGYDPHANISSMNLNIEIKDSLSKAINKSEVLILMTEWAEFSKITLNILKKYMKGRLILDPYGILKKLKLKDNNFEYYCIGKYN